MRLAGFLFWSVCVFSVEGVKSLCGGLRRLKRSRIGLARFAWVQRLLPCKKPCAQVEMGGLRGSIVLTLGLVPPIMRVP